jgi:hemerythrin-like domain-containing protein
MERPDITMMYVVHKAFRRDLARMQAATAQAVNPDIHKALRGCWTTFNQYLTIHHTAEDEMLWPPMRAKLGTRGQDLGLLDQMLDEHCRLEPLLREIDDTLHQTSPADLTSLFADLTDVLVSHFEHEETAALPLVQQTLSAREWDDFSDDQRRRIGLRGAVWFFPWLLDDSPPDTQDFVLALIPLPVRLAYKLVWEPRYRRRSPWRAEFRFGRPRRRSSPTGC